jgi:hypothetical protein
MFGSDPKSALDRQIGLESMLEQRRSDPRRGADKKLFVTDGSNRTNGIYRGNAFNVNKLNSRRRSRHRRCGMQCNAERTVISVRIDRMNVCNLDDRQQGKQGHAQQHCHRESPWPRVAIAAHPCVKFGQI